MSTEDLEQFLESRRVTRRQMLAGVGAASAAWFLSGSENPVSAAPETKKGLRLVMVPKWTTFPYFQAAYHGAQQAAKELGDQVVYTGPTSPNAEQQAATLQSVVAQRPDAILLAAIEPQNVAPVLKRAMAQGIIVVTYDADVIPSARNLFCNQLTYQLAGQTYLDCALLDNPKGGKAVFMAATPTTVNHIQQIAAMKHLMATNPKYKVFTPGETYFVNDDFTQSYNTMINIMQTDPKVKFLLSGSAVSAPAAAQAVDASKEHRGHVWATGAALPSSIKKYLEDGSEKAFALWDPSHLGYMAAYAAHLIKTGSLKVAQGHSFKAGSLGTFSISAQNIANYNRPIIFTKHNVSKYPW